MFGSVLPVLGLATNGWRRQLGVVPVSDEGLLFGIIIWKFFKSALVMLATLP